MGDVIEFARPVPQPAPTQDNAAPTPKQVAEVSEGAILKAFLLERVRVGTCPYVLCNLLLHYAAALAVDIVQGSGSYTLGDLEPLIDGFRTMLHQQATI